jgi:hypothetical protein
MVVSGWREIKQVIPSGNLASKRQKDLRRNFSISESLFVLILVIVWRNSDFKNSVEHFYLLFKNSVLLPALKGCLNSAVLNGFESTTENGKPGAG